MPDYSDTISQIMRFSGGTMRSFEGLADYLIPRRKKVHYLVLVVSVLMIPGIIASFEPIDIESYDMESPDCLLYTLTLPTNREV